MYLVHDETINPKRQALTFLSASMIKISEEELKSINKTSIPLRDGSGYIGYLEGIHMLHCVVGIPVKTPTL